MVIGLMNTDFFSAIEDMSDDDGVLPDEAFKLVNEKIEEFLETIKEKEGEIMNISFSHII